MNMKIVRSILAVLAGFAAVLILSLLTDFFFEKNGVFPPQNQPASYMWWMYLIALVYRSVYGIAGGFITATLAPGRPMIHTVILAGIGLVFALLGTAVNWKMTSEYNAWYPILLVILTFPSVWSGGFIKTRWDKKENPVNGKLF